MEVIARWETGIEIMYSNNRVFPSGPMNPRRTGKKRSS